MRTRQVRDTRKSPYQKLSVQAHPVPGDPRCVVDLDKAQAWGMQGTGPGRRPLRPERWISHGAVKSNRGSNST
jgi:hypothetical protein